MLEANMEIVEGLSPQVIDVSDDCQAEELAWDSNLTVDCGRCPP